MQTFTLVFLIGSLFLSAQKAAIDRSPFIAVLGITQDGGYPQAGCNKECCKTLWKNPKKRRFVASLAIVDPQTSQRWIIDATPDFREQLHLLDKIFPIDKKEGITGILLTHAHIGHYAGLVHFGREAMGAKEVPVFAMPRMIDFLKNNGPWDQLIRLKNLTLNPLVDQITVELNDRISITPYLVYHRDEYTETVGFLINGPDRSVFYLPDIDKWNRGDIVIEEMISRVNIAYLDGTFYNEGEIPGRNMTDIPHPFIVESMKQFANLNEAQKKKIRFIHLNHTNPALIPGSEANQTIKMNGFRIAEQGVIQPL